MFIILSAFDVNNMIYSNHLQFIKLNHFVLKRLRNPIELYTQTEFNENKILNLEKLINSKYVCIGGNEINQNKFINKI